MPRADSLSLVLSPILEWSKKRGGPIPLRDLVELAEDIQAEINGAGDVPREQRLDKSRAQRAPQGSKAPKAKADTKKGGASNGQCVDCGKMATRLVSGRLCLRCYQREWARKKAEQKQHEAEASAASRA